MIFIIMWMKKSISLFFCVSFLCLSTKETISAPPIIAEQEICKAQEENPYQLYPVASEQLPEIIKLPQCPWFSIIEWRTSQDNIYGGPSDKAKSLLGDACQKAVKKFPLFLKKEKINLPIDFTQFHQNISLIPISENFRDLNDTSFRFKDREKTYDTNGQLNIIWGYTDFNTHLTFIRNDIIDKDGIVSNTTLLVFTHELYHAMSWHFKINDYYHNSAIIEEAMAQKFTTFMGLGK